MSSESAPEWAVEPQWKLTYLPQRFAASGALVRDRGLAPTSWYLTPWEADAALAEGTAFAELVDRNDPRLPHAVASHEGPAVVSLVCTRCGYAADTPTAFIAGHASCGPETAVADPATAAPPTTPPTMTYPDPVCREAWMAAARSGTLIEGIDPGWPSRDREALEPWTVELSFDVEAYSREHVEQIAKLLAMITGGRVSGLS